MDLKLKALACAIWCATVAAPVSAKDAFAEGTAAFRNGDFQTALGHFEQARKEGRESASLTYNLGVTLFKLARYQAAQSQFSQLLDDPEWGGVARLQLGLVAEKQGRPVAAVGHYRVLVDSDSPRLRELALKRLNALAQVPAAEPAEARGVALVSLTTGFDDNAYALQNELLSDTSVGEDTYTELFAWGQYQLQGQVTDGWRLHGFAFTRRYSDLDSLNLSSYNLGVSRHLPWHGWELELGGVTELTSLGGERVASEFRIVSRLQQAFGSGELTLAYLPSRFSGTEKYRYLNGWRQRFEARWEMPLASLDVNAFYRLDLDDRADLVTAEDGYYSYSPRRQTFGAELEWPLVWGWVLNAGTQYRLSHYRGSNRLQDSDGEYKDQPRDGNRLRSWVGAEKQLLPRLEFGARIVTTDNDENFNIYTYDKTEASLSVRYVF